MKKWNFYFEILKKYGEWNKLSKYLRKYDKNNIPKVEDIWNIMDQIWDDMQLNNKEYNKERLKKYYSHPVWLLNGLFVENDEISKKHRESIAKYFKNKNNLRILDYGGGTGALAKEIVKANPVNIVDIYEPHASEFAYKNIENYKNIKIKDKVKKNFYDVIVNTDVLEHVEYPIKLVGRYNELLKINGILISNWNFISCIKCHLPRHFHYQYTFSKIVSLLGFSKELNIDNYGSYFYKKKSVKKTNYILAFLYKIYSKILYNSKKIIKNCLKKMGFDL